MRISSDSNVNPITTKSQPKVTASASETTNSAKQGSGANELVKAAKVDSMQLDNNYETKAKVQEVVVKMNEMLDVNNSTSKFMYHDGLDRYYVTVVDRKTEEVVKEIPPKKLLDAFYEMQKMLGMIVDEKI